MHRSAKRPARRCAPRAPRPTPSPSSTPKPNGCCATGWPNCGPASMSSARRAAAAPDGSRRAVDLGGRPDRRHGELRLRAPAYAVSVAVQVDGQSVAGAVANVVDGALYSAARGHGRTLRRGGDDDAAAVQSRSTICQCRWWAPDSATIRATASTAGGGAREAAAAVVRDIRRLGSAALDLCLVAAGQLDAYYEDNLNVWDWAAGALIAAEAGRGCGCRRRAGGRQPGLVVAAAPGVDEAFTDALRRVGRVVAANTAACKRNSVSTPRCGSSTSTSDRRAGWPPAAGWTARLRCRRCAPAR